MAGVPEYWIVNLRENLVKIFRAPDASARTCVDADVARRGDRIELVALPGATVAVDDLLPEV